MKIAQVKVDLLNVPLERPFQAAGREVRNYWYVVAHVLTSDDVAGFGYVIMLQDELVPSLAAATRELSERLLGFHVFSVEAAWERLAEAGRWLGPGGLLHYAIAPLDIAMWDAAAKTARQPLYRMLGGYRDRVPAYASGGLWYNLTPDELAESARKAIAGGFTALKMRVGGESDPREEVRRIETVRKAIGPDVKILVDAAQKWDVSQATRAGRMLQEAGIAWLEDPVEHTNVAGLAEIAEHLDVPIAAGENLYLLGDFVRLLEARVGVAIIDLGRIGGITPWRRAAALAQAYNVPVCGHVLPEVHVHLLAAIPHGYMVEYVARGAAVLQSLPKIQDGAMLAPQDPGIGLLFDQAAYDRFVVR